MIDSKYYSYMLGLYLGDGYINQMPRTYRLRVSLGCEHQDVIDRCLKNLNRLLPNNKINILCKNKSKAVDVSVYSKTLPHIFPQHGGGPKHLRRILLLDWQESILDKFPEAFIAGLFDADGSEYIHKNRVKGVVTSSYRYFLFCNKSDDICNLFIKYCNLLNISVKKCTRKDGVKYLYIRKKQQVQIFDNVLNVGYDD